MNDSVDVELFAGGGGLAVGLRQAGFSPVTFYESNDVCCDTLEKNSSGKSGTLRGTVIRGKVEEISWHPLSGKVRLLTGGTPCQPFSVGGKHRADRDARNLFPEVLRAVREMRPSAVLLENVRGITRISFRSYFDYVVRQLRFPSIIQRSGESWRAHDQRLKKTELKTAVEYNVIFRLFNAADFGVPQNRLRVFIVATRAGLPLYEFPQPTHSRLALERVLSSSEYWARHHVKPCPVKLSNVRRDSNEIGLLPWVTVRDALQGLPEPAKCESEAAMNHWTILGARQYHGHTGSRMDWIAKTIKAGVNGVPGGENSITDDEGIFRYFTLRETARIQTFPDSHIFQGARIHVTRQIGNAVPVRLATAVAKPLHRLLEGLR